MCTASKASTAFLDGNRKTDSIIYGGEDGVVTGIVKIEDRISAILDFEKIAFDINPETGLKLSEVDGLDKRERSEKPILIAEDSVLLRRMLLEALHKSGYGNILSVTNGAEAWEILQKIKESKTDLLSAVSLSSRISRCRRWTACI
jgi:two-component system chemotaxis response regulator CheV